MKPSWFGPVSPAARWIALPLAIALNACAARHEPTQENVVPRDYKPRILDLLRESLDDPTNVRDAAISEPNLKSVDGATRYLVCIRYNPRNERGQYMGIRTLAAVFYAGDLTQLINPTNEQCGSVPYQPFPELQKLCRTIGCQGGY
jgi:hypothetical protein